MYVHIKWIDLLIALYVSCYVLPTTNLVRQGIYITTPYYFIIGSPGSYFFSSCCMFL